MKKLTSLLSLILSFCLIFGTYSVTTYAKSVPTVTIGEARVSAGDRVKIDVVLSDCPKFSSYTIFFTYESEYLTALDAKKGLGVMLYQPNLSVKGKKEIAIVGGDVDNRNENGVISTVEFSVSEDFPGGVVEVPLKITQLKLTEFNGEVDVDIDSKGVDGKIVISGAGGNVTWKGGEEMTPGVLTKEEAAEYKNPVTGESINDGGAYYFNSEKKTAVPAADAEEGIKAEPDDWKVISTPDGGAESSFADEIHTEKRGADTLTVILCVAGGVVVILAAVLAYVFMRKKS